MEFIILALATWRIASLLTNEDGPYDMFEVIRYQAGIRYDEFSNPYPTNVVAEGLMCLWCNSIWIGTFITLMYFINPIGATLLLMPFALSTLAICIDNGLDK